MFVTYQEKAFLQLVARRILRLQRDADSRGEAYNDFGSFAPLGCGAHARIRFAPAPGGYEMVVNLKRSPYLSADELQMIAAELLEKPAVLRAESPTDLEYGRAIAASE